MLNKLKNLIGVFFMFMGVVLAMGSTGPEMTNAEVILQGFSGIFLIYLGYQISKTPTKPIEIITIDEVTEDTEAVKQLSEAVHSFRRLHFEEKRQTIAVKIHIKRSFILKMRQMNPNVFHPVTETFEGWPVEILSEEHDVDFKIFKSRGRA